MTAVIGVECECAITCPMIDAADRFMGATTANSSHLECYPDRCGSKGNNAVRDVREDRQTKDENKRFVWERRFVHFTLSRCSACVSALLDRYQKKKKGISPWYYGIDPISLLC